MLQKSALLLATQDSDKTALLADAAYKGNLHLVQFLLSQGVSAYSTLKNSKVNSSGTPLHEAVRGGHVEVCRVLSQAARNYIKTSDILHYAAEASSGAVCEILIEAGCDVNFKNRDGHTPLHLCAENLDTDVCKVLIEAGADVNDTDTLGCTCLHWAASAGNLGVVTVLVAYNADIYMENKWGENALLLAQLNNRHSVITYLRQFEFPVKTFPPL